MAAATLRDGDPPQRAARGPKPFAYPAAATIVDVLGLHVAGGRFYGETEAFTNAPVAVVDRRAAERLWPGQDPIGKEVVDVTGTARHVVGVLDTLRTRLTNSNSDGVAFLPFAAQPRFMDVAMRDARASISVAQVRRDRRGRPVPRDIRPFMPFERTLVSPGCWRFCSAPLDC
jgi:hypothetical protein